MLIEWFPIGIVEFCCTGVARNGAIEESFSPTRLIDARLGLDPDCKSGKEKAMATRLEDVKKTLAINKTKAGMRNVLFCIVPYYTIKDGKQNYKDCEV